jgi:hypothetical protein
MLSLLNSEKNQYTLHHKIPLKPVAILAMNDSVLVFSGSRFEADLAKGLLEEAGIACLLTSEHGAGFVLQAGSILERYYIYVNPRDKEEAEEALAVLN